MFDLRSSASDAVIPTGYLPARAHLSHDPSARRVPHSAESNKDTTASEGRIITTLKSGVEQAHTPAFVARGAANRGQNPVHVDRSETLPL